MAERVQNERAGCCAVTWVFQCPAGRYWPISLILFTSVNYIRINAGRIYFDRNGQNLPNMRDDGQHPRMSSRTTRRSDWRGEKIPQL